MLGPPPVRVGRVRAAAALLVVAVGFLVGSVFPPYAAGGPALAHSTGRLLSIVVVPAGAWMVAAALISAAGGTWLRLGFGLAVGAALTTTALNLQVLAQIITQGPHIAAAGVWLSLGADPVAVVAVVAVFFELRRAGRLGALVSPNPLLAGLGLAGGAGVCVGFVPAWQSIHVVVKAANIDRTQHYANRFASSWETMVAVVVVLVVVAVVTIAASLLRPRLFGGALFAGLFVGMAAAAVLPLYEALAPFDPSLVRLNAAVFAQYGVHATFNLTSWFWVEVIALGVVALVALLLLLLRDPPGRFEP